MAAGDSLYARGAYDSASSVWRTALDRATEAHDSVSEPQILMWLGLAAHRQGDFAEARTLGERALALKLARGYSREVARSYNALGMLATDEGRLTDAIQLLGESTAAAQRTGDEAGIARAAGNLGRAYMELADFARARENFERARAMGAKLRDARTEGNALANLGAVDIRVGDPRSALESISAARRLYRTIDYGTGEENALGQLGTLYGAIGEPARALATLDSALQLARRQGMQSEEAILLQLIGDVHASLGGSERALRLYGDALGIATKLGFDDRIATIQRSAGTIHARLGNSLLARRSVMAALEKHRANGERLEELDDLLLLADIGSLSGDQREVESRLTAARRISDTVDTPAARFNVAVTEARIADRSGQHRRVLAALRDVERTESVVDAGVRWEVLTLQARAYGKLKHHDSAVVIGRRAVTEVERLRDKLEPGPLRTALVADRSLAYADLALNLLALGRTTEAFEVAVAARGRSLVEHLAAARRHALRGALPDLLTAEDLLRRIDQLLSRLRDMEGMPNVERGEVAASRRDLADQIATARNEYEDLLLRITREYPGASGLLAVRPVRAAEITAALRAGELLVQYLVTPHRLLIFAANPAGIRCLTTTIDAAELTHQVRLARDLLSQRTSDSALTIPVRASLYHTLITPLQRAGLLGPTRHLFIVPHDALAYAPFASLRDSAGPELSAHHALALLPSAGALPMLRTLTSATVLPMRDSVAIFAPFSERLPATQSEARDVHALWPRSTMLLGSRATEAAVRRALTHDSAVHLATHGVMNAHHPMFSRVELARAPTATGSDDDGRLEVHELLALGITSRLVFLSGCETGVGSAWSTEFARGEDYATLAQAFLYAGARTVIATLWPIDDEGSAVFARLFYARLRTQAPAEALAAAQRDMRAQSRYAHPYYWAGYVLTGGDAGEPTRAARAPSDQALFTTNQALGRHS